MEKLELDARSDSGASAIHEPLLEGPILPAVPKKFILARHWRRILSIFGALYFALTAPILLLLARNQMPLPYSPANGLLSYQRRLLYFGEDNKFTGLPQDVDAQWDRLLDPINIWVTEHELRQAHADLSEDIVQLTDGNYVAVLSVHHELHCLDALRRNMYYDYYYPNSTTGDMEYNMVHMAHCVDTIRRSLMCKADLALYTAYWIGDHTAFPRKELRSNSDTICVDWEAIDGWARTRLLRKDSYKVRPGPFEDLHSHSNHSSPSEN